LHWDKVYIPYPSAIISFSYERKSSVERKLEPPMNLLPRLSKKHQEEIAACFENSALNSLKKMGLEYDFYLDYGMGQTDYSKEWRVYFPRNLRATR
jgi:hypothetical protein